MKNVKVFNVAELDLNKDGHEWLDYAVRFAKKTVSYKLKTIHYI